MVNYAGFETPAPASVFPSTEVRKAHGRGAYESVEGKVRDDAQDEALEA